MLHYLKNSSPHTDNYQKSRSRKLTSLEEKYLSESSQASKQEDYGSVLCLWLCMHAHQAPKSLPMTNAKANFCQQNTYKASKKYR